MPSDDWAYLAGRGGQPLEDLIATLLRRKYSDALQRGIAQGDKGIDIIRQTPDGLVVWQVKKFTSPPNPSQWRQIKKSWLRFLRNSPSEEKVLKYHLVTPWTPHAARIKDFAELTDGAGFETQWDGSSFIDGLVDEFPDTYGRFVNGPNTLERLVMAKAVIAGSPIESGNSKNFLEAVATRQKNINALRDLVSDEYYIDIGTRTADFESIPPRPANDPAVYWRYSSLGNGRYEYEAIVPRTADSTTIDPISLEIVFHPEGPSEIQKVREWEQWGVPLGKTLATTTTHGGPYNGETSENVLLSIGMKPVGDELPSLTLHGLDDAGRLIFHIDLACEELTVGSTSGWTRVVLSSPARVFAGEIRLHPTPEATDLRLYVGNLEGKLPSAVLGELDEFLAFEAARTFQIISRDLQLTGEKYAVPVEIFSRAREVATLLIELQQQTPELLTMPDIYAVEATELDALRSIGSLFRDGLPQIHHWDTVTLRVREGSSLLANIASGSPFSQDERVTFELGKREIELFTPIQVTRMSIKVADDVDIAELEFGSEFCAVPGDDRTMKLVVHTGSAS
jgi:hypothetical protein